MIVDCHTHLPGTSFPSWGAGGDLVSAMDDLGIDHAIVFPLDGLFGDAERHNELMADFVRRVPDRLTGFAAIDPRRGSAADEVRRAVRDLGLRGVKLHPWLQGFSPLESYMDPVAERAVQLGVPIAFHDGTPPYATPLQVATVAERHPDLVVILAHSGLLDLWQEAVEAAKRHANVRLVLCGPPTAALQHIVDTVPVAQLLWGTDSTGFGNNDQARHRLAQVHTLRISEMEREAILGLNAARLLDLTAGSVER